METTFKLLLLLMLSFAPLWIVFLQHRILERNHKLLCSVTDPLHRTVLYRRAKEYLTRRGSSPTARVGTANPYLMLFGDRIAGYDDWTYLISILLYCTTLVFCLAAVLFHDAHLLHGTINLLLMGPAAIAGGADASRQYAEVSLAVAALAFLAAYVRIAHLIAVMLNIDQHSPMPFVFFNIHTVAAVFVALIARHLFAALDLGIWAAAAFALLAGMRPDLWLANLARGASGLVGSIAWLKAAIPPEPAPPSATVVPPAADLSLIQGMTADGRQTLEQMDIGDCTRLALHNPFIIWVRTSRTLHEAIDIGGQALLVSLVPQAWLPELRAAGIRTIEDAFKLHDAGAAPAILTPALIGLWRERSEVRNHLELIDTLRSASAYPDGMGVGSASALPQAAPVTSMRRASAFAP